MVKQIKSAGKQSIETGKQVLYVGAALLAMLPVAAGIYSIWQGQSQSGLDSYSSVFTGAMTVAFGLLVLYRVVVRQDVKRG